ncbi:DUF3107 domain-containing protein [Brachybacterium sp. EF45031]|uniref:DUF3107 domain-containing protein n=1 Tax=Brachybacterium sillae TaxID=2810536 RepID=UPI00217DCB5B|nr:DUF3107 domain-containing protein [Brachybacterium sillae]MCS6712449.1 DUF3107 domain-containing protein [Brachybacterium sillae]
MEIRIGIQHAAREIVIEPSESAETVLAQLADAVSSDSAVTLSDAKGRTVLIPGAKLAYAEVSTEEPRRVGFLG